MGWGQCGVCEGTGNDFNIGRLVQEVFGGGLGLFGGGGGGGVAGFPWTPFRPPDKSEYLKIIFLISQPKHMLWVLKRTVSMRRFFRLPTTHV